MPAEDSKVDAKQWYAAMQRWMAEFWHMKLDAPTAKIAPGSTVPGDSMIAEG
jgi:hypothetical protein